MQYRLTTDNGTPVMHITGDMEHSALPQFRSIITDLLAQGHKKIILDMSAVEFMDSGGMSGIIFAAKRLHEAGGHLVLTNCSQWVARKLTIGGLTKMPQLLTVQGACEDSVTD